MALIILGIFIPTSFNKTMVLRNKRGILNRVESSLVCNVSATNFRVNPDFSAVFGYANVNCLEQQNAYQTPGTLCFWGFLIKDRIKQL